MMVVIIFWESCCWLFRCEAWGNFRCQGCSFWFRGNNELGGGFSFRCWLTNVSLCLSIYTSFSGRIIETHLSNSIVDFSSRTHFLLWELASPHADERDREPQLIGDSFLIGNPSEIHHLSPQLKEECLSFPPTVLTNLPPRRWRDQLSRV